MRLASAFYGDYHPFDKMGVFNTCQMVMEPSELTTNDCLIVWGGADIFPGLYGKKLSPMGGGGRMISHRDTIEWNLMLQARELRIPIIGICRGAQMLCALAGGYLIQHITDHGGHHKVVTWDNRSFVTNSCHHQMMVPTGTKHKIVAQIPANELRSRVYWDEAGTVDHSQEPEFIHFTDVNGFAIQWHPEWMDINSPATQYIFDYLKGHIKYEQLDAASGIRSAVAVA